MIMFYIVALGNPGEKYESTRHNVGWMAIDNFINETGLPSLVASKAYSGRTTDGLVAGEGVKILYPDTFMNNSGSAVAKFVAKQDIERLIVVHDDIDLPIGEIKLGKGRGAGGNNGVQSIIDKLGAKDFIRVRIGIAPKSFWTGKIKRPAGGGPLERFVLKSFSGGESKQLPEIFKRTNQAIQTVLSEGLEAAMNQVNKKL